LQTGDADLTVEGEITLTNGKLSSSSGTLLFRKGGVQSGTFEFDPGTSILNFSGDYTKISGTLDSSLATLELSGNTSITSDSALVFNQLELNDWALTLGSASTDLTVNSAVNLNNANDGLFTGDADLNLLSALNISDGEVTSTGGIISMMEGVQISEQEKWILKEVL